MRTKNVLGCGMLVLFVGTGCAKAPNVKSASAAVASSTSSTPSAADAQLAASDGPSASADSGQEPADRRRRSTSSTWLGASAEGEMLLSGTRETFVGVWVDVPDDRPEVRPPMDLALVVDTSGSMAGSKIENARHAASTLVKNLHDGDIVALDAFSDSARTVVPPTRIDARSREAILHAIAGLSVHGSTNMFEGLTLAEGQVAAAPSSHAIRRIVVISDGIANVGPSSPEVLGAVAERGLRSRTQVTSLGVGNDYDERTLNALAVRSSGRLYHLSEPREMARILASELDLLDKTMASDSFIEIVPAAGVTLLGAEGASSTWQTASSGRALRIPLGTLHAGQHREALVRVRIDDSAAFEGGQTRSLASVRLRFHDAQDSDLERVQEVVARAQLTSDRDQVATHVSSRAKAIAAIQDVARSQVAAAQRINAGQFDDADRELAQAEVALAARAKDVTAPAEKKRIAEAQTKVAAARATAKAMPAASAPAQRAQALDMNASGMGMMGY